MDIKITVKKFAKTSNNNNKNVLKQENEKHLRDLFQNLKSERESWNFINTIRNSEIRNRQKYQDSKTVFERF